MFGWLPRHGNTATVDTLQDLTIARAVGLATRDNHDVLLARLAIMSAQAGIAIADAAPNPSLTLGASGINPNAGIGAGGLRSKTVDSSVRIDQLIERGGKRALRVENAASLHAAARHDAAETQRLLTIAVKLAYFDLLTVQDRLVIQTQSAALSLQTMVAARKRLKAGDLAPSDVARLEVDALRAQNDVSLLGTEDARARLVLAQLLGRSRDADEITLAEGWPAADTAGLANIDTVVDRRSDILAAQARLQAAESASKLALASRTRDITVGVQYDHFPASATYTQGGGNTYGITLQIPLFVRYQFDGEIRSANVALESARETLAKARDTARTELMRSLAERRNAYERLTQFEESILPAARKSADAAEFAFSHGALAIMDVLDVRRTYRLTQLDAVSARADYAKAAANMPAAPMPGDAQ